MTNLQSINRIVLFTSIFILVFAISGSAQSTASVTATGYNNVSYSNTSASYGVNSKELRRRNDSLMSVLIADLTKDRLITDKQNFTFKLDKEGMNLNGEKQPQEIYDRYFKKYAPQNGRETNWTWTYVVAP